MPNKSQSIVLNDRGNSCYKNGNMKSALSYYNQAIEMDADNSTAYYNRANLFADLAKSDIAFYHKAIKDYDKALELNPTDDGILYNRAVTHKENNEFDGAIEDFLKVIEMNPKHDNAYFNIGTILYQMGKRDNNMDFLKGAIRYFQKAEKMGNRFAANILNKLR